MLTPVREYFERLNRSFAACYRLLERPRAARRAVVALLVIHSALLAYSAYVHSPTLNEPGHLVAGLSIWKFGRFDVYKVNPPLVKMVAALPVMAAGYEEDWSGFYSSPGARPEFTMGEDFVAANGERSLFLFMIARWACIPFSWLGAVVCYLWARDLYGRPSGVVACAIWCFEPNILAHASLITPDAPATALGLAACYTFWRWLKKPTWSQAALTGVVLGLAELTKTTLILFYPLWPIMWLVYRLMERGKGSDFFSSTDGEKVPHPLSPSNRVSERRGHMWLREGGMLALRMAIGLYVLNLGYGFEGALRPLGEFHFVSDLFSGNQAGDRGLAADAVKQAAVRDKGLSQHRLSPPNRFTNSWLARAPSLFPKNYLLGIDLQQRDFEHYGRPSYLRGEWRDHGWWYYYLYAVAIKVPLGLWALGVGALVAIFIPQLKEAGGAQTPIRPTACLTLADSSLRDSLFLLFPPLLLFLFISSHTGINEHMRYVLPTFPYFYIYFCRFTTNLLDTRSIPQIALMVERHSIFRAVVLLFSLMMLLWSCASSWWIYPHSLSYFNESIGGPLKGHAHLLGSNVDWGQDLTYAFPYVVPYNDTPHLAYVGYFNPSDIGRAYSLPLAGQSLPHPSMSTRDRWVISVNFVHGYKWFIVGKDRRKLETSPNSFDSFADVYSTRVGYTFLSFNSQQP